MSGAESTRTTTAGEAVRVGPLRPDEHDALFEVFSRIVEDHEGFPHAPPLTTEVFAATWVSGASVSVAARVVSGSGEELAGAYYLRPNFAGRAAHIANAGYVVARPWRRRGIGRVLVEDSVARAPVWGFDAIQFNLVFASNPARALYEELGWRAVGRVPEAVDGEDAVIYWRRV
ncbi:MAG TPA: GNAT family N-acetyltransferase [Acidimicrobiales bacterium]|nr:GNAT family N-acetyltransferase [Acidimicrobiales bacterium]